MRREPTALHFPRPTRTVWVLLLSLGVPWAIGVALNIASSFRGDLVRTWLVEPLAFEPTRVLGGQVWRLVTYAWVQEPAGVFRLLIDAVMLWLFGVSLERERGARGLVRAFAAGVGAGGVTLLVAGALMGAVFGVGSGWFLGAQPAVSAVFAAVCWVWRDRSLNLILLQVRGLHLLLFFVALDVLRVVTTGSPEPFASLGGSAAGVIVAGDLWRPSVLRTRWRLWRTGTKLKARGKESPVRWVN